MEPLQLCGQEPFANDGLTECLARLREGVLVADLNHALLESVMRPVVASAVSKEASAALPPREPVTVCLATVAVL